jgi:hypothetical protein
MPKYESGDFEPPAPVVRATVLGVGDSSVGDVPFLIDTGADVSLVPVEVVNRLGAVTQPSKVAIQFLDGQQTSCSQAELTVAFLRYRFSGNFLVADTNHGILGRNIINLLLITLDGPALTWSV